MEHLRRYLERQKLTQEQFAEQMGVKQPTVSDWLNGIAIPRIRTLRKISAVTKLPIGKLLEAA